MSKDKTKSGVKKFSEEFKKFITRGNVVDMATGVVIGGAFSAIVTALVNILLSVCTWGVPGGLKGLVTVLPALNDGQKGFDLSVGLGQSFASSDLQTLSTNLAVELYGQATVDSTPTLIEQMKTIILGKYTLFGTTYVYNLSAKIDWGTFINAIISFLIIAFTLFLILKIYNTLRLKRLAFEEKTKEAYYVAHPEERPVPPEPGKPAPTEISLLTEIKDLLVQQKGEEPKK